MTTRLKLAFLGLVLFAACSPTRGCEESTFSLAADSPLPVWFKLPAGTTRSESSVEIAFWSGPLGRSVTFTLRDKTDHVLDTVVAKAIGDEPIHLDSPYPLYELLEARGVTEVLQWYGEPPGMRIDRDPGVRAAIEKRLRGPMSE